MKLWYAADCLCSFPGCAVDLGQLAYEDGVAPSIPHIISPAKDGPRADRTFPREKLNRYENLILLCDRHHKVVDRRPVKEYTAARLRSMKTAHEVHVASQRNVGISSSSLIGSILYANIPRLFVDFGGRVLSAGTAITTSVPDVRFSTLPQEEWLGYAALVWESLRKHTKRAVAFTPGLALDQSMVGRRFMWWRSVRGKRVYDRHGEPAHVTGNVDNDPQIYFKDGRRKIVMHVDARHAMTSTGMTLLKGAQYSPEVVGLSVLRYVDDRVAFMSPLVIGFPNDEAPWQFPYLRVNAPDPGKRIDWAAVARGEAAAPTLREIIEANRPANATPKRPPARRGKGARSCAS
jgi:hypothetical protein